MDEITYKKAAATTDAATQSAILGPFWRHDAPVRQNGDTILLKSPSDAKVAYMFGTVTDAATGKPLEKALVDIWQASTNGKNTSIQYISANFFHADLSGGLYEQQDPDQPDYNLRGKFYTDVDGKYALYCLRPTPYPVSQPYTKYVRHNN